MATDATTVSPILYDLQEGLKNFDLTNWTRNFDVANFFKGLDLKTFGWLALAVVAVILVVDFFTKSYGPFGRSLAVTAADVWQRNRQHIHFDKYGRDSRSLEPVTEVLDALADAVKKWEKTEEPKVARDRSFYGGRDLW
ncbi:uncharacterized protein [Macrobrachium rosenbergii]|uniref:uncharacterized protein n=1 Tax=Macrobrachium rosenbergii TaxID=79674 RepID=UPI0034D6C58C